MFALWYILVALLIVAYAALMAWAWWDELCAWGWRMYCRWTYTPAYQVWHVLRWKWKGTQG